MSGKGESKIDLDPQSSIPLHATNSSFNGWITNRICMQKLDNRSILWIKIVEAEEDAILGIVIDHRPEFIGVTGMFYDPNLQCESTMIVRSEPRPGTTD